MGSRLRGNDGIDAMLDEETIGITLQIDESPGQVYDGKHSSLHPLFNK